MKLKNKVNVPHSIKAEGRFAVDTYYMKGILKATT